MVWELLISLSLTPREIESGPRLAQLRTHVNRQRCAQLISIQLETHELRRYGLSQQRSAERRCGARIDSARAEVKRFERGGTINERCTHVSSQGYCGSVGPCRPVIDRFSRSVASEWIVKEAKGLEARAVAE